MYSPKVVPSVDPLGKSTYLKVGVTYSLSVLQPVIVGCDVIYYDPILLSVYVFLLQSGEEVWYVFLIEIDLVSECILSILIFLESSYVSSVRVVCEKI